MLRKQNELKLSPYLGLFDILVKADNRLRLFHDMVDWSFVRRELKAKYSELKGRTAVEPEVLLKCLVLKEMTELSDRDLMEEVRVNMAYKYFLDMLPEEMPFDHTLLSKFRRDRLKDCKLLDKLLAESLRLALEHGVLKRGGNGKVRLTVALDSTHTQSLGRVLLPREGIAYFCKKFIKAVEESYGDEDGRWGKVPRFKATDEAVAYARDLLSRVLEAHPDCTAGGKTMRIHNRLVEALDDVADHGTCSPSDRDARMGHKTRDTTFGGYKEHLAVDVESGMVVAAEVTSGEASDTPSGERLVDTMTAGATLELERVIGDGAYGSTAMMLKAAAEEGGFDLVATPNSMLGASQGNYQAKGFTYNKDADMLVCPAGHMALRWVVRHYKQEKNDHVRVYHFDVDKCRTCARREGCYKQGAKTKTCSVTILTEIQQNYLKKTQTEEFKNHFKRRTAAERTNSQLKSGRGGGLRKARYYGLRMMTMQTAVALFVYNLKKILCKKSKK